MTPRGKIFNRAFGAIGIASYVFDTTAEEQADAADILDAMMSEPYWDALGYVPTDGDPQPDVEIDTAPDFDNPIVYNLAMRLAPSFGKTPSSFVRGQAKRGLAEVTAASFVAPVVPGNRIPIGGGGNWWRRWGLL
jgi:hypothetical protein